MDIQKDKYVNQIEMISKRKKIAHALLEQCKSENLTVYDVEQVAELMVIQAKLHSSLSSDLVSK